MISQLTYILLFINNIRSALESEKARSSNLSEALELEKRNTRALQDTLEHEDTLNSSARERDQELTQVSKSFGDIVWDAPGIPQSYTIKFPGIFPKWFNCRFCIP